MEWWKGREFEALSLRYTDHVELLRKLTDLDLKLFTLSVTVQILLGAWLLEHQTQDFIIRFGLLLIDASLMMIGLRLLYLNYIRRCEAVGTLKNIMQALGFTVSGSYLLDKALNAARSEYLPKHLQTERVRKDGFRAWWPYYKWGIFLSIAGLAFVLFGTEISRLLK